LTVAESSRYRFTVIELSVYLDGRPSSGEVVSRSERGEIRL
jgi:hypothetical protein